MRYKRNLNDSDTTARDLSDNVITFLQEKLLEYPYPTHNIIYQIIDLKESDKNSLLEEIILNTIVALIELIIENPQQLDRKFKLLNLLSNAYVSEYNMQKINGIVVPALYDLKENRGFLDDGNDSSFCLYIFRYIVQISFQNSTLLFYLARPYQF